MNSFKGIGDFDSNDPFERHAAHQAAKGNMNPTRDSKPPMFTAGHYNAIAKEIRSLFPTQEHHLPDSAVGQKLHELNMTERAILTKLALNLTKRFKKDNPRFQPYMFLDACSPNNDLYPLSELWEDER